MKNDFLARFYTIDSKTGEYILEIGLEKYDDIFNSWDSSVYNIRDLDASLKSFLEECSFDIDMRNKMKLRFNIKEQNRDEELEKIIIESIYNYYNYSVYITNSKFVLRRNKSLIYFMISMVFLTLTIYSQSRIGDTLIPGLIIQCLTVGGWIFLWEAISILFIQSGDFWKKSKIYKRLMHAPILFKYKV